MSEDLETRRRRALWRAHHRGTKELDLLIGGYASSYVASMDIEELADFEDLLVRQEPELQRWLLAPQPPKDVAPEVETLVGAIRKFHGLDHGEEHELG